MVVMAYLHQPLVEAGARRTDLVPRGIGNLMEAILEMLYNLTERLGRAKVGKGDLPLVCNDPDLCVVCQPAQADPGL